MGKGDKKTKRGKIVLGTYGVRRRRKKANKPAVKKVQKVKDTEIKDKKHLKEKKQSKDIEEVAEKTGGTIENTKVEEAGQKVEEEVAVAQGKDEKRAVENKSPKTPKAKKPQKSEINSNKTDEAAVPPGENETTAAKKQGKATKTTKTVKNSKTVKKDTKTAADSKEKKTTAGKSGKTDSKE
jgi:ribosomal small subunit protein bTHX